VTVVLALATAAAPASATVRHASPGASGNCTTTACDFVPAVNGAVAGDEVIVAPGNYGSEASPVPDASNYFDINLHGEAGKPRPRIFTYGQYGVGLYNSLAKVSHLEIVSVNGPLGALGLDFAGSRADDIVVKNDTSQGGGACRLYTNAILSNSVCWSTSDSTANAILVDQYKGNSTPTLRNVTAVALRPGAAGLSMFTANGIAITVTSVNSIVEGIVAVAYHEADAGNGTIAFNPTYSNIVGPRDNECTPATACTESTSPTNLAGNALFVDLAGNYHQDPMSPTINLGQNSAANGAKDFDGQPRTIGGRTDVGADELSLPPAAVTGGASGVTTKTATVAGSANPKNVIGTRAHFVYGKTKSYGKRTPDKPLAQNATAQNVSAALTALSPGTKYHYRLLADGPGGNGQGVDRTFTTKGGFKGLKLPKSQTVAVHGGSARIKATCPPTAKGHCKGTLSLSKGKKPNVVSLGKLGFDIPKGKGKLSVDLSQKALDLLDKGKVKAKATAKTKDGSGGSAKKTSGKVTLEPPAAKAAAAR
jgi:hypothetical protein